MLVSRVDLSPEQRWKSKPSRLHMMMMTIGLPMGDSTGSRLQVVHRISKHRPKSSHLTGTMIDIHKNGSRNHPVYWIEFKWKHLLDRIPGQIIVGQNIVLMQGNHASTGATWRIGVDTCPIDGGITDLDIEGAMESKAPNWIVLDAKPILVCTLPWFELQSSKYLPTNCLLVIM